jgi:hypothetical protein
MRVMTKDGSFKRIVRRHAERTGQRYTEALANLEGSAPPRTLIANMLS